MWVARCFEALLESNFHSWNTPSRLTGWIILLRASFPPQPPPPLWLTRKSDEIKSLFWRRSFFPTVKKKLWESSVYLNLSPWKLVFVCICTVAGFECVPTGESRMCLNASLVEPLRWNLLSQQFGNKLRAYCTVNIQLGSI